MVEVKDDIIIPYHQERLKELINSIHFPWYFSETTLGGGGYDAFQFIHLLMKGDHTSEWYESIIHCFTILPEFRTHRLVRAKLNLRTPYKKKIKPLFHEDSDKGISYIYYFIDSDGPTLFKGKKVQPKQGRIIRFPANQLHSGSYPHKYDKRIVLNLLFEPK